MFNIFSYESEGLKLRINGEEWQGEYLSRSNFSISTSINADNNFSFELIINQDELKEIKVGFTVELDYLIANQVSNPKRLFTGFIWSLESHPAEQGNIEQFRLAVTCIGLRDILDKRTTFYYTNPDNPATYKTILENLIRNELSNEGFTIGNIPMNFPVPTDFKYDIGTITGFFDQISTITGYNWYINLDKSIDFSNTLRTNIQVPSTAKISNGEFILKKSFNTLDNYYNKIIIKSPILKAQITDREEVERMKQITGGSGIYAKIYSVDTNTSNWKPLEVCKNMLLAQSFIKQIFEIEAHTVILPGLKTKIKWQGYEYDVIATESTIYFRENGYIWSNAKLERLPPAPKNFSVRTDWKIKFGKFISTSNSKNKDRKKTKVISTSSASATFKLQAEDKVIIQFSCQINAKADENIIQLNLLLNGISVANYNTNTTGKPPLKEFYNTSFEKILQAGTQNMTIQTRNCTVSFISFRVDSEAFAEVPLIDAGDEELKNLIEIESNGQFIVQKDEIFEFDGNILGGDNKSI